MGVMRTLIMPLQERVRQRPTPWRRRHFWRLAGRQAGATGRGGHERVVDEMRAGESSDGLDRGGFEPRQPLR